MGNIATPEFLIARWDELCRDPSLANLPYKIELNAWGKVEMGPPAGVGHGHQQSRLVQQIQQQLPGGVVLIGCPVVTAIGVRAPDVVWASDEFRKRHKRSSPLPRAPEICVEIFSPSNFEAEIIEKTRAYLDAGAVEVWVVARNGSIRYIDRAGEKGRSQFPVTLELPDVTTDYL